MDNTDQQHGSHYRHLAVMAALSFIAMYGLMYAMVDTLGNVYNNINQVYMAALMAAPMVAIELSVMGSMYRNRKLNYALGVGSVIVAIVFFALIRLQTAVHDKQFLRSMIPHHAGAVLMCGKAPIDDVEIKQLCAEIIRSQQDEIAQMRAILDRLER